MTEYLPSLVGLKHVDDILKTTLICMYVHLVGKQYRMTHCVQQDSKVCSQFHIPQFFLWEADELSDLKGW